MKQIYVAVSSVKGYSHVMKYLDDVTSHPQRECIEQRVEPIKLFDDYGEDATRRAFGKSRSTIYLWKQKLKQAGGKLSSLAPGNRAPIRKRRRIVDPLCAGFHHPLPDSPSQGRQDYYYSRTGRRLRVSWSWTGLAVNRRPDHSRPQGKAPAPQDHQAQYKWMQWEVGGQRTTGHQQENPAEGLHSKAPWRSGTDGYRRPICRWS